LIETAGQDVESSGPRKLADVFRDVYATGFDSKILKRSKQDAIVAAEFHDPLRMKGLVQHAGIALEVFDQRSNRARSKAIILKEDVRIDYLENLYESAFSTNVDR
jgi:hypothetical protein